MRLRRVMGVCREITQPKMSLYTSWGFLALPFFRCSSISRWGVFPTPENVVDQLISGISGGPPAFLEFSKKLHIWNSTTLTI